MRAMEDPKKFNIDSFQLKGGLEIEIQFCDGKKQVINFSEHIEPGWMSELNDTNYFCRVKLNDAKNLEWPNGQDFKPEHLYYWEEFSKYYKQT